MDSRLIRRIAVACVGAVALTMPGAWAAPDPGNEPPPDINPPLIEIGAPPGDVDGWHPNSVTITLTVSDARTGDSGLADASYTLSGATTGGSHLAAGRPTSVQISNEGSTTITINAEDRSGLTSTKVWGVGVDRTAPIINFTPESPTATYTQGQVSRLSFECPDAHVGTASCTSPSASGTPLDTSALGTHSVTVTARDRLNNTRTAQYTYTVVKAPLVITGQVGLQGTARVGRTLNAIGPYTMPEAEQVDYVWKRDGTTIDGASGDSYTLQPADVDAVITVQATAAREGMESVTATATSDVVQPGLFAERAGMAVKGTGRVGAALTANVALAPAPQATTYVWLRGGKPIPGATKRTYTPTAADVGRSLTVEVGVRAAGYQATTIHLASPKIQRAKARVTALAKALKKRKARVRVAVSAPGVSVTGKVTVKHRGKVVARGVTLRGGKATINLKGLKKGRAALSVTYHGSPGTLPASTITPRIRIR